MKKTTFNYNDEQLSIIREMVSNRQDLVDRRKSGKYQDTFASQYKITQNPPLFNGSHSRQEKLESSLTQKQAVHFSET